MAKVVPAFWTPWIQERMKTIQNILTMGMVEEDNNTPITKSGKYYSRPVQQHLGNATAPVDYDATTVITPGTVDDFQENIVTVHKGAGYKETEYDRITRGQNGLDSAMLDRAEIVLQTIQTSLVNSIKGAFATALATTNTYDATGLGTGIFTVDIAVDACETLFDENADDFDKYTMHSKQYAKLKKDGFIDFQNATNFADMIVKQGQIPTLLGKPIAINNTLCANEGTVADPIYPIFMTQGKPFILAWQRNVRLYEDFQPSTGGGTDMRYWYADYAIGVKGVSWTAGTYDPSNTGLATGANWTKVYQTKDIKVIKIKTLYI